MNTMIQQLRESGEQGNQLYVKREDLLGFSMGGNKVRIAETFFEDMQKKHCNSMIIYGSRHSNLCRVLANLCCSRQMECIMICSHEEQDDDVPTNNSALIEWAGTKIVHCKKTEIADTVDQVMEELQSRGKNPYYIYGNRYGKGNEGTAAAAYAEVYQEITAFEQKNGWEFDYIFCPCGTGATHSGLVCGHLLARDRKKIVGIMISSREYERAYTAAKEGICGYFAQNGYELPASYEKEIILTDRYTLGGYGKYDENIEHIIREEYCINSIALDPIYTAKAFWGMKEYIKENEIKESRILFLHTGGTPLFYDYLQKNGGRLC